MSRSQHDQSARVALAESEATSSSSDLSMIEELERRLNVEWAWSEDDAAFAQDYFPRLLSLSRRALEKKDG